MELSHLRALVVLAELANFAPASGQLHLSPPAVFGQIHHLEEEIGEKPYEPVGKGLTLTDAGYVLVEHARGML